MAKAKAQTNSKYIASKPSAPKIKRPSSSATIRPRNASKSALNEKKKQEESEDASLQCARNDPYHRGMHADAVQAGRAPSGRSTCVDCLMAIAKGAARWGIKYAGNPLSVPVVPLYGSNPMVMWCHAACFLSYVRYEEMSADVPAARTCHLCQDGPDGDDDHIARPIRFLCGGPPQDKTNKIQSHAFHVECWTSAIKKAGDEGAVNEILGNMLADRIGSSDTASANHMRIPGTLQWSALTNKEKDFVLTALKVK